MRQRLFPAIFQDTLNGTRQVEQAFLTRHTLAVRFRHFGTGGNQELVPRLNNRGKLVLHDEIDS